MQTRSGEVLNTAKGRIPDFFIVGSPKTGTTSLYHMLRGHPQIFMASPKEPRFLASDMRVREGFAHEPREQGYPISLDEYLALFARARAEQRAGEASTFYLWSKTAAEQIARLQPQARIIAILREPASFLCSLHLMYLGWRVEDQLDLRRALSLEVARGEGRHIPSFSHRPQLLQYAEHVRYVEQLRRYSDHLAADQMLVLIYDDFTSDNAGTVRRVLRFLGVNDDVEIDSIALNVTAHTIPSWRAKRIVDRLSDGGGAGASLARALVKAVTPRRVRQRVAQTLEGRVVRVPPADERLMLELRRRFKDEVVALAQYLDRDLVRLWRYDEID